MAAGLSWLSFREFEKSRIHAGSILKYFDFGGFSGMAMETG